MKLRAKAVRTYHWGREVWADFQASAGVGFYLQCFLIARQRPVAVTRAEGGDTLIGVPGHSPDCPCDVCMEAYRESVLPGRY